MCYKNKLQTVNSGLKAITGVMLIITCTMIPSSIILPQSDLSLSLIPLHSNWQIQGLFLTSLLCGPEIGMTCAISYMIIGLFYLPVFHGGGSIGYILTHEFGYLLGFIPAAWTCGYLSKKKSKATLINYSIYTVVSLSVLHLTGIIYLVFGKIFWKWTDNISDLILANTIITIPSQVLLCLSISLISIIIKRLLILK